MFLSGKKSICLRETVKNYLEDFFHQWGNPPTPLAENHFAKKTLSENMGYPPSPLNRKSAKHFQKKDLEGLKMTLLYKIRLKIDLKGHIIDPKYV